MRIVTEQVRFVNLLGSPGAVQPSRWFGDLAPAGEEKREAFEGLMESLGIEPKASGESVEACPFCHTSGATLLVSWTSAAFRCLSCGERGGVAKLSALYEEQRAAAAREGLLRELEPLGVREYAPSRCPFCGAPDSFRLATVRPKLPFGIPAPPELRFACQACERSGDNESLRELLGVLGPFLPKGKILLRRGVSNPLRDQLVREGVRRVLEADDSNPWTCESREEARARASLERVLGSYDHCGKAPHRLPHVTDCGAVILKPSLAPCNELAHERCLWFQARRDLAKWAKRVEYHLAGPVAVLRLTGPGLTLRELGEKVRELFRRSEVERLFARTVGYLSFGRQGRELLQLVRRSDLDLLPAAREAWSELVPGGEIEEVEVDDLSSAFDLLCELRCIAEQSLFILVATGQLDPHAALKARAEELKARGSKGGGHKNRIVFGPGFKKRPPKRDEGPKGSNEEARTTIPDEFEEDGALNTCPAVDHIPSNRHPSQPLDETIGGSEGRYGPEGARDAWHGGPAASTAKQEPGDDLPRERCPVCGRPGCRVRPDPSLPVLSWVQAEALREVGLATPLSDAEDADWLLDPRAVRWLRDGTIWKRVRTIRRST